MPQGPGAMSGNVDKCVEHCRLRIPRQQCPAVARVLRKSASHDLFTTVIRQARAQMAGERERTITVGCQ